MNTPLERPMPLTDPSLNADSVDSAEPVLMPEQDIHSVHLTSASLTAESLSEAGCSYCGGFHGDLEACRSARITEIEIRSYSDGTTATGTAPLPTLSPQQQDAGGEAEHLRMLLICGAVRLREWHAKYGEHQPQWLPPSGDVLWLEDVDTALAALDEAERFSAENASPIPSKKEGAQQ